MRNYLENWVMKSFKSVDQSCECSNELGIPDWEFDEMVIDLMPIWMSVGFIVSVIVAIIKSTRKQI
jgi:hypothetical protein